MESLPKTAPFGAFHNGDRVLGELCYAATRVLRPKTIVETGVCYGVTSAHLLAGLEANGFGHLHSIDLPPLGKNGDDYVGWLVPEELRKRWILYRGTSRKMLSPLLKKTGTVNLFVHDSLHTHRNMKREFAAIWPRLSPGGMVIADDIDGNTAFQEFSRRHDVVFQAAVREVGKDSLAGILIKQFDANASVLPSLTKVTRGSR
jgi:predicted O-methyltransferase YrrM